ncbi:hypothetical protein [Thiobacillus denitrificans]|uniref:hypothetical protein n=1 Tax=Thiobacillus denitrificans TaxID=36861 RepID=UPI000382C77F|nr:hypothetical protein [Thiobacillus denitrificans]
MKDKNPAVFPVRQWRRVAMAPSDWGVEMKQLFHVCGRALDLRVVVGEQGQHVLEVLCATDDELAQAEALLHQSAADEALRRDIYTQCNKEIGMLVDSVLKRATGK